MQITPLQSAILFCEAMIDEEQKTSIPSGCADSYAESGAKTGRLEAYIAVKEKLERLLPAELDDKRKAFHAGHCVQALEKEKGVKYTDTELFEAYIRHEHTIILK